MADTMMMRQSTYANETELSSQSLYSILWTIKLLYPFPFSIRSVSPFECHHRTFFPLLFPDQTIRSSPAFTAAPTTAELIKYHEPEIYATLEILACPKVDPNTICSSVSID